MSKEDSRLGDATLMETMGWASAQGLPKYSQINPGGEPMRTVDEKIPELKQIKYQIQVFLGLSPVVMFQSVGTFMDVSVNDLVNTRDWPSDRTVCEATLLKVIGREHFISETGDTINHAIHIYTEVVEDKWETREFQDRIEKAATTVSTAE